MTWVLVKMQVSWLSHLYRVGALQWFPHPLDGSEPATGAVPFSQSGVEQNSRNDLSWTQVCPNFPSTPRQRLRSVLPPAWLLTGLPNPRGLQVTAPLHPWGRCAESALL